VSLNEEILLLTLDNLTGQILGQYRVIKPIGSGGMARIYLAKTKQNKYVALKVLLPHLQNQPDFAERFLREAQHATRLRHKYIVSIHDYQQLPDGITFFAMDWIDDGSLAELIQTRQKMGQHFLTLQEAAQIIHQIATALDYAHKKGIVHRDIKPSNILLGKDGRAMLADFGVAKVAQATTLTRPGEQPGTPAYMAPEQAQGAEVSPQTDIYALGIVLYEMLAGRPPFQGDTSQVLAVLYQQVHEAPPALKQFNPQISPLLEAVVKKVLAKKPDERYTSAGAFAKAVRQAVDITTTEPTQSSSLPLVIGIGSSTIVALLCLLVLLWYNYDNNKPQIVNQPIATNTTATTITTSEVGITPTSIDIVIGVSPTPVRDEAPESGEAAATIIDDDDDDDATTLPIERPILLGPADGAEIFSDEIKTLTWRWQPLVEGQQYQITIRDETQKVSTWRTINRQLSLSSDLKPGRYTWLVMVTTTDNEEIVRSTLHSFTVVAPAPTPNKQDITAEPTNKQTAPTLLGPEDGFSRAGSEDITLRWNSIPSLEDEQCYVLLIYHKQGIDYIWLTDKSYTLADEKRWLSRPEFGPDLRWQVVIAEERDDCRSNDEPTDIEVSNYSQPRNIKWIDIER